MSISWSVIPYRIETGLALSNTTSISAWFISSIAVYTSEFFNPAIILVPFSIVTVNPFTSPTPLCKNSALDADLPRDTNKLSMSNGLLSYRNLITLACSGSILNARANFSAVSRVAVNSSFIVVPFIKSKRLRSTADS